MSMSHCLFWLDNILPNGCMYFTVSIKYAFYFAIKILFIYFFQKPRCLIKVQRECSLAMQQQGAPPDHPNDQN